MDASGNVRSGCHPSHELWPVRNSKKRSSLPRSSHYRERLGTERAKCGMHGGDQRRAARSLRRSCPGPHARQLSMLQVVVGAGTVTASTTPFLVELVRAADITLDDIPAVRISPRPTTPGSRAALTSAQHEASRGRLWVHCDEQVRHHT